MEVGEGAQHLDGFSVGLLQPRQPALPLGALGGEFRSVALQGQPRPGEDVAALRLIGNPQQRGPGSAGEIAGVSRQLTDEDADGAVVIENIGGVAGIRDAVGRGGCQQNGLEVAVKSADLLSQLLLRLDFSHLVLPCL